MTGPDVSNLAPRDAVVALRSFPRRFREAIARAEAQEPGSGDALLPLVQQAVDALGGEPGESDPLAKLEAVATASADAAARVSADEWAKDEGRLAALREAVRAASVAVHAAEDAVDR